MEVGVLFEKDGILALNKPAGMISQGPKTSHIPELWELVRTFYPAGHVAHRIDQFTTGINLAGISRRQLRYLMSNWHTITRKTYLAIIKEPYWVEMLVTNPIGGKSASTFFKIIEHDWSYALVECTLVKNGRTHQIRRHLRSLGSPIVGDRKYNGLETRVREGQLLHAWRMEVRLSDESGEPGQWETIQAPIPDDFRQFQFDWDRWDAGANETLKSWQVPTNWR